MNIENNVYKRLPLELKKDLVRLSAQTIERYGVDPATKPQAAAHEAAHIIMATVMGQVVTGAKIFKTPVGWYGRNYRECKSAPTTIVEDPLVGLESICNNLAGKMGELAAGYDHESSSIDEIFRAHTIASELDRYMGWPLGKSSYIGGALVELALLKYQDDLGLLQKWILENRGIKRKSLAPLIKDIEQFEAFKLVGEERRSKKLIGQLVISELGATQYG